jgi:ABC-2 type transport system permease protein
MRFYRIKAVMLRHLLLYINGYGRFIELLYWPLRDIIMWGLTSLWISSSTSVMPNVMLIMLSGIVIWQVVLRSLYISGLSIFEELIAHNLVNLVSSPLTLGEWVVGIMGTSVILSFIAVVFGMIGAKLIYGVSIWSLGILLVPSALLSLMFGWTLGFIGASFTVLWGIKAYSYVSILSWLFAPFLGIFTPITLLPAWAITFSRFLPASYVFSEIRNFITNGYIEWPMFLISFALNAVYLTVSLILFATAFDIKRARGLPL